MVDNCVEVSGACVSCVEQLCVSCVQKLCVAEHWGAALGWMQQARAPPGSGGARRAAADVLSAARGPCVAASRLSLHPPPTLLPAVRDQPRHPDAREPLLCAPGVGGRRTCVRRTRTHVVPPLAACAWDARRASCSWHRGPLGFRTAQLTRPSLLSPPCVNYADVHARLPPGLRRPVRAPAAAAARVRRGGVPPLHAQAPRHVVRGNTQALETSSEPRGWPGWLG